MYRPLSIFDTVLRLAALAWLPSQPPAVAYIPLTEVVTPRRARPRGAASERKPPARCKAARRKAGK